MDAMPGGQFCRRFPAQAIKTPAKGLQVFGAVVGWRPASEFLDLPLEALDLKALICGVIGHGGLRFHRKLAANRTRPAKGLYLLDEPPVGLHST